MSSYDDRLGRRRGRGRAQSASKHDARKASQLAQQIEERLRELLAFEALDERFHELRVLGAEIPPGAAHVSVALGIPRGSTPPEGWRALLEHARTWLRSEIASAIHRRRTPELVFELLELDAEESR